MRGAPQRPLLPRPQDAEEPRIRRRSCGRLPGTMPPPRAARAALAASGRLRTTGFAPPAAPLRPAGAERPRWLEAATAPGGRAGASGPLRLHLLDIRPLKEFIVVTVKELKELFKTWSTYIDAYTTVFLERLILTSSFVPGSQEPNLDSQL
ncbi:unnamed protein product [Bubo scandiacus]